MCVRQEERCRLHGGGADAGNVTLKTGVGLLLVRETAPCYSAIWETAKQALPSVFSSFLCRQAFQMGLNEKEK